MAGDYAHNTDVEVVHSCKTNTKYSAPVSETCDDLLVRSDAGSECCETRPNIRSMFGLTRISHHSPKPCYLFLDRLQTSNDLTVEIRWLVLNFGSGKALFDG